MKSPLSPSFLPAHTSLRSVGVDRFRLLLKGWSLKVLSLLVVVMVGGNVVGQVASWALTSATTTATTVTSNATASAVTVSSGTIAYQASPSNINVSSWSTSTSFSTAGKYWQVTITPNANFQISVSGFSFDAGRTSAGPAKVDVQYSLDGFATAGTSILSGATNANISTLTTIAANTNLPISNTTNAITFRIWGYNASGTGNFRINNISISGSVSAFTATDYFWNGGNLTNNTNNSWDNNTTRNWGITNGATFAANTAPGVVWPSSSSYNANFNNAVSATSVSLPAAISVMPISTIIGTSGYTFAPSVTQTFSSPITLSSTLTIAPAVSTIFTLSGIASGTGGLIHNGSGATTISAANTFTTAGFTLTNGTVVIGNANALGAASSPLALNGGTISSTSSNFSLANTALTVGGNFQLGEIAGNVSTAGAGNLTFGGTVNLGSSGRIITLGNAGAHVFSGVISNTSGGLTFAANNNGTGRIDLTNSSNTFTGAINLNGNGTGVAEVRFTADGSFGNTSNTININGGRLATLSAATYTLTSTRGIQVGNTNGTSISTPGAGVLTYDGVISDLSGSTPGAWAKQGGGTLSLGGVSTYTGATAINNGTLTLTTGNDRLPTGTILSLGQAASSNLGTFDLNGRNQTIAGLNSTTGTNATASNNTITSSSAAILTVSGSSNSFYGDGTNTNSGVIIGSLSLVKSGSSSLTLADANTYTGTTTVSAGTLFVNGSLASGSAITVDASGTLAGSGTAAGTVSLTGTVSPGGTASTTATLSTGAFTFNSNSTYKFEMNNATGAAGNANGWDKITSSGAITCSATPITIDITSVSITNFSGSTSYSWVLAQGTSISGFNSGNFTLSTSNFSPSLAGGSFSISSSATQISLIFTSASPSVITSGSLPDFGAVTVNTTSPASSFPSYNASGAFLTNDITITPPLGVEISTSNTFASNIGTNGSPLILTQTGGIVSSTPIYVRFAPTAASGSFSANITNSSSPAPTQNVAITGKAVDTEPTTQTTSISFSSVTSTTMTVNFNTTGNGAKRILVAKAGSAVNSDPVDGTTYTANLAFSIGTQIGTGNYVLVASNASSANITGLSSGTTYHFALYEYNDNTNTSGAENYNTTTAPIANATTTTPPSTWSGATSVTWLTATNWSPSGAPSGVGAEAFFNINTNAGTNGINMNGIWVGNSSIGAIHWGSSATSARTVTNSSGTAGGTLTLNGITINSVANTILRNAGSGNHNITPGSPELIIGLGNSTENIVNIDGTGVIAISSVISSPSGTTPLTITGSGSGRLDLTNTANTFTGTITISGAEARFKDANSFGNVNNTIIIDGGRMATSSGTTYTLASTHAIRVGATANTSISVVNSGTLTYDGIISNKPLTTGAWAKQGAGTLALGGISSYTGSTAINNGTIQLTTGNDRLPTSTVLSLGQAASTNLGTLNLNGQNQTIGGLNSTSGTNATASNNIITSSTAAALTVNGAGSYGDGTHANSGIIEGAISLIKSGSGILTLGDANTYTGATTVSGGTLQLAGSNVGSVGSITSTPIGKGTLNLNGGTLSSNGTTDRTVLNAASIGGDITLGDAINTGALTFAAATNISDATRTITTSSAVTFSGVIGDGGNAYGITKVGSSTLTLSGANTYTGATTVNQGILQFSKVGGNTIPVGNSVIINGGTLQISSNQTLETITLNSGIIQVDNGVTLTINNLTIPNGATLRLLGTGKISGSGTFILSSGSTLISDLSISSAILNYNAKSFSSLANYELNGEATGTFTTTPTPNTVNNLTINKSSGAVTLNQSLKTNGALTLTSGTLDIGANTLTIAGSVSRTNGNIDADAGTLSFDNTNNLSLPASLFSGNIYNLAKASGAGTVTLTDNLTVTNELTSAASTGAIIIPSSKVLTVSGTGKATINGTLTNDGTFTLNSGATLLQGSGSSITGGAYNVKQNITGSGSGTPSGRFWYVGSPVSGATSAVYDAAGANILKYYSESANAWQEITDNNAALEVGRGYFVQAATGTSELNFTGGTINNNTYTLNVTRNTTTNAFRGYNLLTNPYPSYLDWDNVTRSNVGTTMWYRAANSGGTMVFDTYNVSAGTGTNNNGAGVVTNFIPPMQSFWVNVPQGQTTGTVSFGNDQRSHYSTGVQGLRSSAQDFPAFLRLNLLDGNFVDQTILYLKPDASNTFDEYDSEKMFLGGVPQFYSTVNAKKLVLNGMKNQKARTSVPLTMELPSSKSYTFQAEEFNIEDGLILLEDKQEGVIQDLTINPTYSFFGNTGTNATRFVVHFQLANAPILVGGPQALESLGSDELLSENIQIISNNQGKVTIRLDEGFKPEGSIRIFDASGRLVEQTDFNDQETTIQLKEQAGMYFVEVSTGKLMVKKKIVIE